KIERVYLAVVEGIPEETEWTCRAKIASDLEQSGRMRVDNRQGKEAETHFRVVQTGRGSTLVEARPVTGRTHQIRIHAAESRCPVVGDDLYGRAESRKRMPLGLRAVLLAYTDPFT